MRRSPTAAVAHRTSKLRPTPESPCFQRLGTPWWVFLLAYVTISASFAAIGCGILYTVRDQDHEAEHKAYEQALNRAMTRLQQRFSELETISRGLQAFVSSQIEGKPPQELPQFFFPNGTRTPNEMRNKTIPYAPFESYILAVKEYYIDTTMRIAIRPTGLNAFTIYPLLGGEEKLVEDYWNTFRSTTIFCVARGSTVYTDFIDELSGLPFYAVVVPIYKTDAPRLNRFWNASSTFPLGAFLDWWGVAQVNIELQSFVRKLGILEDFAERLPTANVVVRLASRSVGNVNASVILNTTHPNHPDLVSKRERANDFTDLIVSAMPQVDAEEGRALWHQGASPREYLIVIIVTIAVSAICVVVWATVQYRLLLRREASTFRSRFAPREPPVAIAIVEVYDGSTLAWMDKPVEMAEVTSSLRAIVDEKIQRFDVCKTRVRNDAIEISAASALELLRCVLAIHAEVARRDRWTEAQRRALAPVYVANNNNNLRLNESPSISLRGGGGGSAKATTTPPTTSLAIPSSPRDGDCRNDDDDDDDGFVAISAAHTVSPDQKSFSHFSLLAPEIQAHFTIHLATRVRGSFNKATYNVEYDGDDVADLYAIHDSTAGRAAPILLTEAFNVFVTKEIAMARTGRGVSDKVITQTTLLEEGLYRTTRADDVNHTELPTHFVARPPKTDNCRVQRVPLTSTDTFPLHYAVTNDAFMLPPSSGPSMEDSVSSCASAEPSDSGRGGLNFASRGGMNGSSTSSSVNSDNVLTLAFGCPERVRADLSRLLEECVTSTDLTKVVKSASFFYTAYLVAFSPFSETQFAPVARAVDEAFSLTPMRRGLVPRQHLFQKLAVRCARIHRHVFTYHDRYVTGHETPPQVGVPLVPSEDGGL